MTASPLPSRYHPAPHRRRLTKTLPPPPQRADHLACAAGNPTCCEFGIRIMDLEDPALQYGVHDSSAELDGPDQFLSRCADVSICGACQYEQVRSLSLFLLLLLFVLFVLLLLFWLFWLFCLFLLLCLFLSFFSFFSVFVSQFCTQHC